MNSVWSVRRNERTREVQAMSTSGMRTTGSTARRVLVGLGAAALLGLLSLGDTTTAWAHIDPPECSSTSVGTELENGAAGIEADWPGRGICRQPY